MVLQVGLVTGSLMMLAIALVLGVGWPLLPLALVLQVIAARWAARRGKAREFWGAGTVGVILVMAGIWLARR